MKKSSTNGRYYKIGVTALAAGASVSFDVGSLVACFFDTGPNTVAPGIEAQFDDCNPAFQIRIGMYLRFHFPVTRVTFKNNTGGPLDFSMVWSGNPNFYILQGNV